VGSIISILMLGEGACALGFCSGFCSFVVAGFMKQKKLSLMDFRILLLPLLIPF
jgi:hypothetical protein